MLDLLSRVEPEFQEKVRRNVLLAGGGSQIRGLAGVLDHLDAAERHGPGKLGIGVLPQGLEVLGFGPSVSA